MWVKVNGQPHRLFTRDPNAPFMTPWGKGACRLPSGHPEAFLEAFANIYTAAYADMVARADGKKFETKDTIYPNVYDGVDGMNFVTQCVVSSKEDGAWRSLKHPMCRA
jgi:hypothetical protein